MQQHRQVEDDRERKAGDVLETAQTWRHLVDPRATTCDERRDHEPRVVTSTSLPAVPTLMVPGRSLRSGRAGVRDDSERCSDTCRGYPTLVGRHAERGTVGALA